MPHRESGRTPDWRRRQARPSDVCSKLTERAIIATGRPAMKTRIVVFLTAVLLSAGAYAQQPTSCPTSASVRPAPFVPPAPHRATLPRGSFWYGSESLWTSLREDGRWHGLYRSDLRAHRNKVMLFRKGFDSSSEHRPPLVVTARRLDGPSLQVTTSERASGAFNENTGPMIMTAIDVPDPGCWSLSAQYADERPLIFVVSVP